MHNLARLAVRVKVLGPADSLSKAAEVIRCSGVGAAPIVDSGVLVGMITAESVARSLLQIGAGQASTTPITEAVWEGLPALPEHLSAETALRAFQEHHYRCAAVLSASGEVLGLVTHAELASAACGAIRPPVIGGMATPFGVYLTGGGVRAGVGDGALCAAGAVLGVQFLLATWLADVLLAPGGWAWQFPVLARVMQTLPLTATGFSLALFALLFRVSLLTGFHAAEHQVVHAIEAGDDLRPDTIRSKPRVHPRCGTNLVAAVMLMSLLLNLRHLVVVNPEVTRWLLMLDQFNPMLAMLITVIYWKRVGGWIQRHITTRRANPREILSGLKAGKELVARYQGEAVRRTTLQRLWSMGLLQVMFGYLTVVALVSVLGRFLPLPSALRLL